MEVSEGMLPQTMQNMFLSKSAVIKKTSTLLKPGSIGGGMFWEMVLPNYVKIFVS